MTRHAFAFRPTASTALAAVMLTLVCTPAAAQDTTGVGAIRGVVVNATGQPAEGVVDNVEIPNINAFANFASAGGTVSLLDAELLQDVTFLTGGSTTLETRMSRLGIRSPQRPSHARLTSPDGGGPTAGDHDQAPRSAEP